VADQRRGETVAGAIAGEDQIAPAGQSRELAPEAADVRLERIVRRRIAAIVECLDQCATWDGAARGGHESLEEQALGGGERDGQAIR
jgi:hypothetical protein